MRNRFLVILFFMIALVRAQFELPHDHSEGTFGQRPEFYVLDWKKGEILTESDTPLSIEIDSMGQQQVSMLVNKASDPVLYSSNIETPVCADGECRLMHIRLYWTLLGEYAGFDRYPGLPLTKHDHDEFLQEDYLKLHRLLRDKLSILERRSIDELVVKPEQPEIEGADALSGATIAEVKESVVSGALYSCYVAWHLVHGAIKDSIKAHTTTLIDDDMIRSMLYSNNVDYQMFVLNRFDENQYVDHSMRIAEIFESAIPMVRTFIIKNLPDAFWANDELQSPFWESFSQVDINSRSLLLDHLDTVSQPTLNELSAQLGVMTKNQLKLYLQHVETLLPLGDTILKNLEAFSKSGSENYAYLVTQFLEDNVN